MSKILAILGSGQLGQQIAHFAVADNHYKGVVFFDDFSKVNEINGFRIIGTTADIESEFEKKSFDELIIGIGYNHLPAKKSFFDRFENSIPFGTIIHSTSWIDPKAIINPGSVIYPTCCIDANVVIGHNTIVNLGCTIAHDTIIGKHSFLAPRAAIAGFVKTGESCFLGINSTIIDNISIESSSQTGAGAVIIKDITEQGLYVGNPAKKIK